jgi:hypothetical protein
VWCSFILFAFLLNLRIFVLGLQWISVLVASRHSQTLGSPIFFLLAVNSRLRSCRFDFGCRDFYSFVPALWSAHCFFAPCPWLILALILSDCGSTVSLGLLLFVFPQHLREPQQVARLCIFPSAWCCSVSKLLLAPSVLSPALSMSFPRQKVSVRLLHPCPWISLHRDPSLPARPLYSLLSVQRHWLLLLLE